MAGSNTIKPNRNFKKRIKAAGGASLENCYQCATCSAVCKLSPDDRPFPRKEMILAQWGMKDKLVADPDVWLCHQCNDCTVNCPRGARPGDVMAAIRTYSFEHFAFPGFMGKLLARPSGLPILFLIPIVILALLADWSQITTFHGHVHFYDFLKNGILEMLFMGGNAFIFILAAVGLARFYSGMSKSWGSESGIGFIAATFKTVLEIVGHGRFGKCDASGYRRWAHMLVFFGFMGAMATAGLALIRMEYLHYCHPEHYPLSDIPAMAIYHPIKLIGNFSGIAMVVGLVIIFVRRGSDSKSSGVTPYVQWLFLTTLLIVASTGLLIQFLRMGELPMLAYGFYFIHLVFVFFLLWYAPYSQFGHMFYRTFAMIFSRSINRLPRRD